MLREGPAQRPTVHIHPSTYAILKCFPPTLVKELNLFREMISAFKIIVKSNSKSFCSREEEKTIYGTSFLHSTYVCQFPLTPLETSSQARAFASDGVKKVKHDSRSRMVISILILKPNFVPAFTFSNKTIKDECSTVK